MTIDWENNDRPLDLGVPYFQTNPYHSSKKTEAWHSHRSPAGPHKRPPTEHPGTACRDRGPGPETQNVDPGMATGRPFHRSGQAATSATIVTWVSHVPTPGAAASAKWPSNCTAMLRASCGTHAVHALLVLSQRFFQWLFHAISNWNYGNYGLTW